MKKTFKRTSAFVCAMAVMAAPMTFSSFVANAGSEPTNDYTLTIPATLAVANSGWNSIGDLTATGTLAQGKKLNVTATSENSWKLTSSENTVAYKLCGETEKEKTYADAAATTALDISKESLEQTGGFSVPIGIVVEDYSTKPAGDYSDTVTFTAKVEDAVTTKTVTWTGQTLKDHSVYGEYQDGFTAEGVTLTTEGNSNRNVRSGNNFYGRNYNSFSVSDGKKFTKIVIEGGDSRCELNNFPGATVTSHVLTAEELLEKYPYLAEDPEELNDKVGNEKTYTITWTGNAETVRFMAWIAPVETITFTIE